MESFPGVAGRVLQEFRTLLQHGPSLLGSTHMLQIITINMFTIHNKHSQGKAFRFITQPQVLNLGEKHFSKMVIGLYSTCSLGEGGEERSALHEQSIALGLGMFALLVQRCTELLRDTPTGIQEHTPVMFVFCQLSQNNVMFNYRPLSIW